MTRSGTLPSARAAPRACGPALWMGTRGAQHHAQSGKQATQPGVEPRLNRVTLL
jgi:hypothetical protein